LRGYVSKHLGDFSLIPNAHQSQKKHKDSQIDYVPTYYIHIQDI